MKKRDLLKRIEALEEQVKVLSIIVESLQSRVLYVTPTTIPLPPPWEGPWVKPPYDVQNTASPLLKRPIIVCEDGSSSTRGNWSN